MVRSLSVWNYNPWRCSKLFFYYVSPFWNLVPLQQITLIKKHKGNLPPLLVCTWSQRLLFSGYFHVNSLRKKFYSIDPPKWPPCHALQNQELFNSINRLWHSVIFGLFWKNCSYASGIECFHSRGQHLCKFLGTKESVYIRKEFNSHRTGLGHQHGCRFIVLGHQ